MKILIFSDSHGSTFGMKSVIERNRDADVLLHLGDGRVEFERIAALYPQMDAFAVDGNCDARQTEAFAERILTLAGVKLLMTHGHRFGVREGISRYLAYAASRGVRCALFGHTHIPLEYYDSDSGITLFNPGSIAQPREGRQSFGTLEIRDGALLFGHGTL